MLEYFADPNISGDNQYVSYFIFLLAISKPTDCVFPYDLRDRVQKQNGMKMEIMGTERALLGFLLAKIHKVDPDVIVVRGQIVFVNGVICCANVCVN